MCTIVSFGTKIIVSKSLGSNLSGLDRALCNLSGSALRVMLLGTLVTLGELVPGEVFCRHLRGVVFSATGDSCAEFSFCFF